MILTISMLVFLAVLAFIYVVFWTMLAKRRGLQARINRYLQSEVKTAQVEAEEQASNRKLIRWRYSIRLLSKYFETPQLSRRLEHRLIQAGWPLRGAEFVVVCVVTMLAGCLLFFVLAGGRLSGAVIGTLLGFTAPILILHGVAAKRLKQFNNQLGDALILIANSLRTGYSFLQAIEMVSQEMPQPIAGEFARLLREMNLGVVTEDALNNLARRVNTDDLDLIITAVLIQRQVGGNLAEVLDNIAVTIRERIKIKGEIRTLTAQGRMSGLIIGVLPFCMALAIFFINPSYLQPLFQEQLGHVMIGSAIVSQIFGIIFINKIIDIDV